MSSTCRRNTSNPSLVVPWLVTCALFLASTALGFNPYVNGAGQFIRHNSTQPVPYYINLGSYASAANKADLIQGIRNAFQHVEDNPFISLTFNYLGETTTLPSLDGVSVVYLDGSGSYVGSSSGVTMNMRINSSSVIESADIALNGQTHAASPFVNLYALALHELCHFLGLGHSSSGKDSAVYESTVNLQLSPDDVAGLATIYPDPANPISAQRGTVRGRVTAADGTPLQARLIAYDLTKPNPRVITRNTNADGTYELPGLPSGAYNIVAETLNDAFLHRHAVDGISQAVAAGTLLENRDVTVISPGHLPSFTASSLDGSAAHPISGHVYSSAGYYGPVLAVNPATGETVASISMNADDVALTLDARRLVVVSQIDRKLNLIDTEAGSPTLHQVVGQVTGLPFQPVHVAVKGNSMAYVSCNGGVAVAAVDLAALTIAATIMTNEYNQDITLSPDGLSAYVGTFIGAHNWIEIDTNPASASYHTIVRKFTAGTNNAWQVRADATGQRVFIATSSGIDVRRRSDNLLLGQIVGGRNAFGGMAFTPDGTKLAFLGHDAADLRNNELVVLDATSLSVVERVAVGGGVDHVSPGASGTEFLVTGDAGLVIVKPPSLVAGNFSVSPTLIQVRETALDGRILVAAGNSSLWQVQESTPWIRFKFTDFRGSGSLDYTLDPNLLGQPRTASVMVAGQNITLVQGGIEEPPVFSVTPHSVAVAGSPFSLAPVLSSHVDAFAATGLPSGLTINPSSGFINGTPTVAGTYGIQIRARNIAGTSVQQCSIAVTSTAMPDLAIESARVTNVLPTQFTLVWTVRNVGTVPVTMNSPTIIFQKYISSDTLYNNSGDLAAGGYIYGSVQPGQSFTRTEVTSRSAGSSTHPYVVAKIDSGNALTEASETNNTLAVPIEGLDFNLWKREGRFTIAEQSNPAISGLDADPDRDGRSNWLEYAFDCNPRVADAGAEEWLSLMLSPRDRFFAEFSFRVPSLPRKDVRYDLRASAALDSGWLVLATKSGAGTWSGARPPMGDISDGRWSRLPVTDMEPLAGMNRRFISISANPIAP